MDTLKLLKQGRFNSGLLAFSFAISTVQAGAAGSLFAIIGAIATFVTIRDAVNFHEAIKAQNTVKGE